jgi:hypothetical protein
MLLLLLRRRRRRRLLLLLLLLRRPGEGVARERGGERESEFKLSLCRLPYRYNDTIAHKFFDHSENQYPRVRTPMGF